MSLTPNNTTLVGEVRAVLSKEKLAELLQHKKKLDARQVQVTDAFSYNYNQDGKVERLYAGSPGVQDVMGTSTALGVTSLDEGENRHVKWSLR